MSDYTVLFLTLGTHRLWMQSVPICSLIWQPIDYSVYVNPTWGSGLGGWAIVALWPLSFSEFSIHTERSSMWPECCSQSAVGSFDIQWRTKLLAVVFL